MLFCGSRNIYCLPVARVKLGRAITSIAMTDQIATIATHCPARTRISGNLRDLLLQIVFSKVRRSGVQVRYVMQPQGLLYARKLLCDTDYPHTSTNILYYMVKMS